MTRNLAWLIVLVAVLALSQVWRGSRVAVAAEIPEHRPVEVTRMVADLGIEGVRHAYLLAFTSQYDADRSFGFDSALLAVEQVGGTWMLEHAYCHPHEDARWHLAVVNDAPVSPSRTYQARPTPSEVEEFITHSWWQFKADDGFKMTQGVVYYDTWQALFGYHPNHRV
jgi:hypothetical protein